MEAQFEVPAEHTDLNLSDLEYLNRFEINDSQPWLHRVEARESDLERELDLVGNLVEVDTMNYWKHRQSILKMVGTAASAKELSYTAKIISKNAKNYYAWSHRQWILKELEGNKNWLKFEEELYYCDKILKRDVCNAFAWNQRLFVVRFAEGGEAFMRSETFYAIQAIQYQPDNEYPWRYLRILYYDDTAPLCYNYYEFYVHVLREELFRVEALSKSVAPKYEALIEHDVPSMFIMNRRACLHALNLILEFLNRGYEPGPETELVEAIDFLYPDYSLSLFDRVRSLLQSLDEEANWRVLLYKSLNAEQNKVFLERITDIEELVNEASESRQ